MIFRKALRLTATLAGAALLSGGLAQSATPAMTKGAAVDGARLLAADSEPGTWMAAGRTYSEQRYSPLTGVNKANVGKLGLAWYADVDTERGQESTPVVVDGALYFTTAWSKVFAYDAKTGKKLWNYDPKVDPSNGADRLLRRGQPRRRGLEGQALSGRAGRPADRARRQDRQGRLVGADHRPQAALHHHPGAADREGPGDHRQRRRGIHLPRLRLGL